MTNTPHSNEEVTRLLDLLHWVFASSDMSSIREAAKEIDKLYIPKEAVEKAIGEDEPLEGLTGPIRAAYNNKNFLRAEIRESLGLGEK